jgi:hypothetical protein
MFTDLQYILEPVMNISLAGKCVNDIPLISTLEHFFSINQFVILYCCYLNALNLSLQTIQTTQNMVL